MENIFKKKLVYVLVSIRNTTITPQKFETHTFWVVNIY